MSPALKGMNKALMVVLNTMEKLDSATADPLNVAGFNEARNAIAGVEAALNDVDDSIRKAKNEQDKFTNSVSRSEDVMGGLIRKVGGLVAAYVSAQSIMGAVNLSDQLTMTKSRLKLVVDDEGSVAALEKEIMASANRSRASYLDTSDAVSKLALRAGDAFQDANNKIDTGQIIAFTENLNKMYAIAGATGEEQASSMLQLTQALGSGVLRGEEFNAVFEAAPNIMQEVARYMDVPIGKLRELAADGQISAEVVKNAILSATDSINADFENMDMTWAQVMTLAKNRAIQAFNPVLEKINELANNTDVQNFINNVANGITYVATAILWAFEQIASFGQFISDNWSTISPYIYAVAGALLFFATAMAIANAIEIASATISTIVATGKLIAAAAMMLFTGATWAAAAAQMGLNTAMYACPIVWIIALVMLVVAAIVTLIGWILKTAGVTNSVVGGIIGTLNVAVSIIWNLFLLVLDIALGVISAIGNAYVTFANFFGNIFNDPVASIINLFGDMADTILGILQSIASAIDKVFGSNLASAVSGWRGSLGGKIETLSNTYGNGKYQEVMDKVNLSSESLGLQRKDYGASFKAGASFGDGIANKVSNFSVDSLMNKITAPDASSIGAGGAGAGGYAGNIPDYDELAGNVGGIKDNTKGIKDAVEVSEEDLKYLRDIAEQETINRFTTAQITVDVGGISNNINSQADLDGFYDGFADWVYEKATIAAEGVHD
jgi:tape measure domain-containing protein